MVWWHRLCPTGGEGICALLSPFLIVPFPSIPWEAREAWEGISLSRSPASPELESSREGDGQWCGAVCCVKLMERKCMLFSLSPFPCVDFPLSPGRLGKLEGVWEGISLL